jgi:hypothetical protein
MRRSIPSLLVFCVSLLAAAASAQDDSIALKCAQSKLKAAGKGCACVHKAWTTALAHGELPDFTACNEKLVASFAKAEARAVGAGGQCWAGETAGQVAEALAAAADKTVSQVGRGTITPAPDACDDLAKQVAYAGGDYSKFPKCVDLAQGDDDCSDVNTLRKFDDVVKKDFKCPGCPSGEKGCDPYANIHSTEVEMRSNSCCIKADAGDAKKSVTFEVRCTLCISE